MESFCHTKRLSLKSPVSRDYLADHQELFILIQKLWIAIARWSWQSTFIWAKWRYQHLSAWRELWNFDSEHSWHSVNLYNWFSWTKGPEYGGLECFMASPWIIHSSSFSTDSLFHHLIMSLTATFHSERFWMGCHVCTLCIRMPFCGALLRRSSEKSVFSVLGCNQGAITHLVWNSKNPFKYWADAWTVGKSQQASNFLVERKSSIFSTNFFLPLEVRSS